MPDGLTNNSDCDRNSSKESSSLLEKADPPITGKGMDYSAYQAVEQNSSDVVGCGFFHVGCEEKALTFPAYQPDFHLKGYRRVNLWGKDRPWTDTELQVKSGDVVYFYGTGEVTTCPHSNCNPGGPKKLDQLTISSMIGKFAGPTNFSFWKHKSIYTSSLQIWHDGNLQIAVLDWDTYPPPGKYYDDNSGVYLLDIFVIDRDQEEGFNRFKDAILKANPNDSNAKAYLGR